MPRKFFKENDIDIPAIAFELDAPVGFTEITEQEEIKTLYILQYQYRIQDGQKFVLDFTADVYIDVLNGVYSDIEAFQLEAHIKELYNELNNGLWLTAKNTNTNLEVLGVYTQELKDEIQAILDAYVFSNY